MSAIEQLTLDDALLAGELELPAGSRLELVPPAVVAPAMPATKARSSDRGTAKQAALEGFPRAGNQRHRILVAIASSSSGLTYDGVVEATGILGVSASTRITELSRAGWIEEDGERKTSSGGTATVWIATERARAHLQESNEEVTDA